jgi:hypothetical protein
MDISSDGVDAATDEIVDKLLAQDNSSGRHLVVYRGCGTWRRC